MHRLHPQSTAVIVVDIQERLVRAIPQEQMEPLLRATRILLSAARVLKSPVFLTEQYPQGLGPTHPEVSELVSLAEGARFEKLEFSACGALGFLAAIERAGARAGVVMGLEAHICVFQTVRDLVSAGVETYVPIDGVASRRDDHKRAGLELCARAGAFCTTSESVLFDWLARAGTDEFKELAPLVR
ncbi:MAG TPA: isochorismatase family protein [Polyangiaceae bacterium]|jgi:nicotinamidase-related amidase